MKFVYILQTLYGSIIKKGMIDIPNLQGNNQGYSKVLASFIKDISSKYSFDFKNPWDSISNSFSLK